MPETTKVASKPAQPEKAKGKDADAVVVSAGFSLGHAKGAPKAHIQVTVPSATAGNPKLLASVLERGCAAVLAKAQK